MIEIQIEELKCLLRISDHTITVKDYQKPLDGKKEVKKTWYQRSASCRPKISTTSITNSKTRRGMQKATICRGYKLAQAKKIQFQTLQLCRPPSLTLCSEAKLEKRQQGSKWVRDKLGMLSNVFHATQKKRKRHPILQSMLVGVKILFTTNP